MSTMNELQFAILAELVDEPSHGYALMVRVADSLGKQPGVATTYACLEKLQAMKYIRHDRDEVVRGRLRRYFAATDAGTAALSDAAETMARRAAAARRRIDGAMSRRGAYA